MKTHPLKREDYPSATAFGAAIREWHRQNPTPQSATAAREDDENPAYERESERYAESQTIYGEMDILG